MNPYLRGSTDLGFETAREARVFPVNENVHVAAKLALFVEHAVADSRVLARQSVDNFRDGHPNIGRERQFDHVAAAGPSAQC
jgi:hypothetical protein